jgi:hypothetical protein
MVPTRVKILRTLARCTQATWLVGVLAITYSGLSAQQVDTDRPRLSHQTEPIPQSDPIIDTTKVEAGGTVTGTPIGDGLVLSAIGHVWARDVIDGRPQLVQLKFVPTDIDRHAASNTLKASIVPFVYKPKEEVEIDGASASIRLRDPRTSIYVRGFEMSSEDAAPSAKTSTQGELAVVQVESKKDRRIVSTVIFTQFTGKVARNSQSIEITFEKVGNTDWKKITPKEPLEPGEYALVYLPHRQDMVPAQIFDFAIDPKAPASQGVSAPDSASPSQ